MNISTAAGYSHTAVVQPKPSHPRPAGKDVDRDSKAGFVQQQSPLQIPAKGSVNLLV